MTHDLEVLVITETRFSNDVLDSEFLPDGYVSFRCDHNISIYKEGWNSCPDRGRVMILIESKLKPVLLEDGIINAEIIWVKISARDKTILSRGYYHPEVDGTFMINKVIE